GRPERPGRGDRLHPGDPEGPHLPENEDQPVLHRQGLTMSTTEVDLAEIDQIVAETGKTADAVIPILRKIQQRYRWPPETALRRVCETTQITPSGIAGVSTFYSKFRHKPAGRHSVNVC